MTQIPAKPAAFPNSSPPLVGWSRVLEASLRDERRHRPRAQLELPVRVRWLGPFGLETELTQTCNASRDGLLVYSALPRQQGSLLWATFPFDPAVAFTESETPGKVVRTDPESDDKNRIAISFQTGDLLSPADRSAHQESSVRSKRSDRRSQSRILLAYLVRVVRSANAPGESDLPPESPFRAEDTMTVDVSPDGMVFCTPRIYSAGEELLVAAQMGTKLSRERRARVIRVGRSESGSPLSYVAVEFLS